MLCQELVPRLNVRTKDSLNTPVYRSCRSGIKGKDIYIDIYFLLSHSDIRINALEMVSSLSLILPDHYRRRLGGPAWGWPRLQVS